MRKSVCDGERKLETYRQRERERQRHADREERERYRDIQSERDEFTVKYTIFNMGYGTVKTPMGQRVNKNVK